MAGSDGVWEIDPTNPSTLAIYADEIYGGNGYDALFRRSGRRPPSSAGQTMTTSRATRAPTTFMAALPCPAAVSATAISVGPTLWIDSTASQWIHQGIWVRLGGSTDATAQTF